MTLMPWLRMHPDSLHRDYMQGIMCYRGMAQHGMQQVQDPVCSAKSYCSAKTHMTTPPAPEAFCRWV